MAGVLGLALLGAVATAGPAVAAVDPVEHTVDVTEVGPGSWQVPELASEVQVTLRGAAGELCERSGGSAPGGAGGVVALALSEDVAGSELSYTVGAVGGGSPEREDGSPNYRGGAGTAVATDDGLLAVVGGGGGGAATHDSYDIGTGENPFVGCVAGGAGGVATSPGVGAGQAGLGSDLFDSHAPGDGGTETGGQPDPEASFHENSIYGGQAGEDGPPSLVDGSISLSAGGYGGHIGGGGGSGYAGGAGGTFDYATVDDSAVDDLGAGGGGSGFLVDDPRVSAVPGSAGTNHGAGSITITYLMPGPATAADADVETGYGDRSVRVTPEVDGATILSLNDEPEFGQADVEDLDLVYTPDSDFVGTDSFTYTASGPGGDSDPATVTIIVAAPDLTVGGDLPEAIQGHSYEHTLTVTGGTEPHEFTAEDLPEGIALDDGGLTGNPTAAGEHPITVTVADSSRPEAVTTTVELVLHVHSNQFEAPASAEAGTDITLTGTDLPDGDYDIVLRSDPVTLGQTTITGGVLEAEVTIAAETSTGEHTLELVREGVVIGTHPLEVTAPPAADPTPEPEPTTETEPEPTPETQPQNKLPETGATWTTPAVLALLLIASGAAALGVRRIRSTG
ncbi:Ig-like domain-containing protein [Ruania halotolerans]|uniref:Ig-like domain-containing protein n=1 Tax=Ruania halotolerans TaxID=2897773 RepID=UPI001E48CD54|nr:Ig-like domain-containing protein [Ruania halotolerans]UFU06607.1 Ig-like domain-containing protein [Ruania halotolerans]